MARPPKTQEQVISEFHKVHGDRYDYSQVVYKHSHGKIVIGCTEHGPFKKIAADHKNGGGCPSCGMANTIKSLTSKPMREKAKQAFEKKYGGALHEVEDFKAKRTASYIARFGGHPTKSPAVKAKTANTNIMRGRWKHPDEDVSDLHCYTRRARRLSKRTYEKWSHVLNPNGYKIGRTDYHIDHKLSIRDAYDLKVPMEILCHPENLRVILSGDNIRKGRSSVISLTDLTESIRKSS